MFSLIHCSIDSVFHLTWFMTNSLIWWILDYDLLLMTVFEFLYFSNYPEVICFDLSKVISYRHTIFFSAYNHFKWTCQQMVCILLSLYSNFSFPFILYFFILSGILKVLVRNLFIVFHVLKLSIGLWVMELRIFVLSFRRSIL